jgi:CDGSH-type Zn-finger protein
MQEVFKMGEQPRIKVVKDGPYIVSGGVPIAVQTIVTDNHGDSVRWAESSLAGADGGEATPAEEYSLCRCGKSRNKPYCDGAHVEARFNGRETASRVKYIDRAERIEGPLMDLTDAEDLCAYARFCHPRGTIWNLTMVDDPRARDIAVQEARDCPSGRLVAWDGKTGRAFEPSIEPSIGVVKDPAQGCAGPLWVRGGIPIESSDGTEYEVRKNVTLCRCGKSGNKPFCDGTHASAGWTDER